MVTIHVNVNQGEFMNKSYPISKRHLQQGAVLLESLIAVLIFSLGVLALAGLQSAMIKNTDDAKYRAEAAFVAQQVLGRIWTNADGAANLAGHVGVSPVTHLPSGSVSVAVDANSLVTVTVNWTLPGDDDAHRYTTMARVEGL